MDPKVLITSPLHGLMLHILNFVAETTLKKGLKRKQKFVETPC